MLRHAVLWSMLEGHETDLDDIFAELRGLPEKIGEIEALSVGRLVNESEFDAALCVDVGDASALERYRAHPAHQPVLEQLRATASNMVVADYEF